MFKTLLKFWVPIPNSTNKGEAFLPRGSGAFNGPDPCRHPGNRWLFEGPKYIELEPGHENPLI